MMVCSRFIALASTSKSAHSPRWMPFKETNMGILSKSVLAALAGLFLVSLAPQASAQDAARDAAILKCTTEAATRVPDSSVPGSHRQRTDIYISCMKAAGLAP